MTPSASTSSPLPNDPVRPELDFVGELRASITRAFERRQPDVLVGFRYDVASPDLGVFETRDARHERPVGRPDGKVGQVLDLVEDVAALVEERRVGEAVVADNVAQALQGAMLTGLPEVADNRRPQPCVPQSEDEGEATGKGRPPRCSRPIVPSGVL